MDLKEMEVDSISAILEIFQDVVKTHEQELKGLSSSNDEDKKVLLARTIQIRKTEIEMMSIELKSRIDTKIPKHSIEEIYFLVGQYDKYCLFDLFPFSEAYQKYGHYISGTVLYNQSERRKLEVAIKEKSLSKNNGLVKISAYLGEDFFKKDFKEIEIMASDICSISSFNEPPAKVYNKTGQKEIPNTLKLKTNPWSFEEYLGAILHLYKEKINDQHILEDEYKHYCGLLFIFRKEQLSEELKQKYVIDSESGIINTDTAYFVLGTIPPDSMNEQMWDIYFGLRFHISEIRIKLFCDKLGISLKTFEEFKKTNLENYKSIVSELVDFKSQSLSQYITKRPVYFDLERFIHVYAKHCKEFFLNGKSKKQQNATLFQYKFKDIEKIASHAIKKHKDEIDKGMEEGKGFYIHDDKAFYYNGNHYRLRIDKNGKILQFFSEDIGTE